MDTQNMEALTRAIDLFDGSQAKLARAIDADSPQLVNNWLRRGNVPAEWCPNIEQATERKVLCEELRPDVRWHVLRGPIKPSQKQ